MRLARVNLLLFIIVALARGLASALDEAPEYGLSTPTPARIDDYDDNDDDAAAAVQDSLEDDNDFAIDAPHPEALAQVGPEPATSDNLDYDVEPDPPVEPEQNELEPMEILATPKPEPIEPGQRELRAEVERSPPEPGHQTFGPQEAGPIEPGQNELKPAVPNEEHPIEPGQDELKPSPSPEQPPKPGELDFKSPSGRHPTTDQKPIEPGQRELEPRPGRRPEERPIEPGQRDFQPVPDKRPVPHQQPPMEPGQRDFRPTPERRPDPHQQQPPLEPGQRDFRPSPERRPDPHQQQPPMEPGQRDFRPTPERRPDPRQQQPPMEPGQREFRTNQDRRREPPIEPGRRDYNRPHVSRDPAHPRPYYQPERNQWYNYGRSWTTSTTTTPAPRYPNNRNYQDYRYPRPQRQSAPQLYPHFHYAPSPPEHPALVTRTYTLPYPTVVWRCQVDFNNCNLKNRVHLATFSRRSLGADRTLMLDINQAVRLMSQRSPRPNPMYAFHGARLVSTRYLAAQYANACLFLSYQWSGNTRRQLYVMQRNQEEKCIFADYSDEPDTDNWRDIEVPLDLRYGDAKFMIEFQYRLPPGLAGGGGGVQHQAELGYLALRNFTISYGNCPRATHAFECDLPAR